MFKKIMCNSTSRLLIVLCTLVLVCGFPQKFRQDKMDGHPDPWQEGMAELREFSKPIPPLVHNAEADLEPSGSGDASEDAQSLESVHRRRRPDFVVKVPPLNMTMPRVIDLEGAPLRRFMNKRDFGDQGYDERYDDYQGGRGHDEFQGFNTDSDDWGDDFASQDQDDPDCPRDLYVDQMHMDFGEAPKKYDWEQIGRHFVNYGRFTADMSDDLMRGLDYRFKQMKG